MLEPVYDPLLDDIRLKDTDDAGMTYDPYLEEFRMKDTVTGKSYDPFMDEVRSTEDPTVNYNLLKADTTMFKADRTLSLTIENEHTNVREQFILLNERFTELYLAFNQFI